jgi:oligopeptide/dipeptide ABC transporter ATP-binding protein
VTTSDEDVTTPSKTAMLLEVDDLVKHFTTGRRLGGGRATVRAVDGVSFSLAPRATLGLVGESGSGKSTVARLVLRLMPLTSGSVRLRGEDISDLRGADLRSRRRAMQMVFQDPYSSFDPTSTVGRSIAEPLRVHRRDDKTSHEEAVASLLELVGLSPTLAARRPSQLSGGQLQRAAIARALAVEPDLLVLDEAVSALDVSSQAVVLKLLDRLKESLQLGMLFISHDLAVVRHVCDRIAVMYFGRIVEEGPVDDVYSDPKHPYTVALLAAVPGMEQRHHDSPIVGDVPSGTNPPSGCRFRTRCPHAMETCAESEPPAVALPTGGVVYCHLY